MYKKPHAANIFLFWGPLRSLCLRVAQPTAKRALVFAISIKMSVGRAVQPLDAHRRRRRVTPQRLASALCLARLGLALLLLPLPLHWT